MVYYMEIKMAANSKINPVSALPAKIETLSGNTEITEEEIKMVVNSFSVQIEQHIRRLLEPCRNDK